MDEKLLYKASVLSYDTHNPIDLNQNFKLKFHSNTLNCYVDESTKQVIIGIRGTNVWDFSDVKADLSLPFNNLHNTNRFQFDDKLMREITEQYPPQQYSYYMSGHSLGTAVMTELMRRYPFVQQAVGYNGAFQPKDFQLKNENIKRLYVDKDPLYRNGGFMFNPVTVIQFKSKGFFDWFFNRISGKKEALAAHRLPNFKNYYGMGYEMCKHRIVSQIALKK